MMKKDTCVLRLDASYQVKHENYENFKTSFLKDVYNKAAYLIRDIIDSKSKGNCDYSAQSDFMEPISNTIAFIGKRGSGKTSAMLSFCDFLKNVKSIKSSEGICADLLDRSVDFSFTVLNSIDATLLEDARELVGAILGNMLLAIKEKERLEREIGNSQSIEIRKLKERLGEIYRSLFLTMNKEEDIASGEVLEQLSRSWNQQQAFREAVRKFNAYMVSDKENAETHFLVIPIDDVDMNLQNGYQLLETIRKYLMDSHVILLLAADDTMLKSLCVKQYKANLPKKTDKEEIGKLATEYLEKILPTGRKIYMPDLYFDEAFGNKEIQIRQSEETSIPVKKLILSSIWKYTGIILDKGQNEKHWIQPDSLRKLSNYYNDINCLEKLISRSSKEDAFKLNIKWLYNDVINRYLADKIVARNNEWVYSRILRINAAFQDAERKRKLEVLINAIEKETYTALQASNWLTRTVTNSYGGVITQLYREMQEEDYTLVWVVAMLLSLYMRMQITMLEYGNEEKEEQLQSIRDFTKGDYWGDYDYDVLMRGKSGIPEKYGDTRKSLGLLEQEVDVKDFTSGLSGMECILLAIQADLRIEDEKVIGTFRFGNFVNVIFHYEDKLKDIIDLYAQSNLDNGKKYKIKEAGEKIQTQLKEWEDKWKTRRVIPFDSAEWMLSLYRQLYGSNGVWGNGIDLSEYSSRYKTTLDVIQKDLESYDNYYENVKHLEKNMEYLAETIQWVTKNYAEVFSECPFIKMMYESSRRDKIISAYADKLAPSFGKDSTGMEKATTQDD